MSTRIGRAGALALLLALLPPTSPLAQTVEQTTGTDLPTVATGPPPEDDDESPVPEVPLPPPEQDAPEEPPAPDFRPPLPQPTAFDWLQLTTGEWLKGKIRYMRDRRIFFDSEELDNIELKWRKIAVFHSARDHTYRFVGLKVVHGTAIIKDDFVRIAPIEGGPDVLYDRGDLVSISPGGSNELDHWSFKITAGVDGRSGNTKQSDLTGYAMIKRQTVITRFMTDYEGAYNSAGGRKTANNHRVNSSFDVFLTKDFFVRVPTATFYRDEFQNLDGRITAGAGVGYEIFDTDVFEWDVGLDLAYQHTRFDSTTNDSKDAHDAATVLSTGFEIDTDFGIDFDSSYQTLLVVTDFGKTSHHSRSTLSFDIWGPLDLDLSFTFDRIEEPQEDRNSDTPKSNDYRYTVGLTFEYP